MGYVNPLSKASISGYTRIDQGVDFTGSGPVLAIGDARIVETNGSGWPGGPYMSYQLLNGPAAGKYVYLAENINPTVSPGQTVKAGQQIATMFNGGTGIETGWAAPGGGSPESQSSSAGSISGANLPPGGTMIGRNFEDLLRSLGVGPANNVGQQPGGVMPPGYPQWSPGLAQQGGTSPASPASASTAACVGFKVFGTCVGVDTTTFQNDIRDIAERVGLVLAGIALVLFGLWKFAENTETSKQVKGAAKELLTL